jgi:putative addiction module component (TIGR02574 family)
VGGVTATPKRFFRYLGDMAELLEQLKKLPAEEQRQLAYALLGLSDTDATGNSLDPRLVQELLRRQQQFRDHPETAITWEELKARFQK